MRASLLAALRELSWLYPSFARRISLAIVDAYVAPYRAGDALRSLTVDIVEALRAHDPITAEENRERAERARHILDSFFKPDPEAERKRWKGAN